ncbi:hypothetical protein JOC54_000037 [Alkalihalobacillus xiaoxiensis]|uniref:Uncharacterized protein n=1 Tax=Shouchella xiaoxiensis TaxID=766895 RepID=A0ABS2SNT2_9BACI|nr:hypothetical protein [Shouchella xiaoxiensis]MBM7836806.1 hypothetical protein [Shouchella xiaoxiensis]
MKKSISAFLIIFFLASSPSTLHAYQDENPITPFEKPDYGH